MQCTAHRVFQIPADRLGLNLSTISNFHTFKHSHFQTSGEVPEWFNGAVSKTVVALCHRGFWRSHPWRGNPSLSADVSRCESNQVCM